MLSNNLVDYLQVSAGQVLIRIDGESSENEMFTIQQSLETAQEELAKAEKNLANCNAVAPIDGTVIGLTLQPGDEINTQSPIATISDTTMLTVSAMLDERHVSFVKTGMSVDLDQWDNMGFGTVESVSLSSTVNNGVAQYPMTIVADNLEGTLQVNSSINYRHRQPELQLSGAAPPGGPHGQYGGRIFPHGGLRSGRPAGERRGGPLRGGGDPRGLLAGAGGDRHSG